jgi:hypothetical protein
VIQSSSYFQHACAEAFFINAGNQTVTKHLATGNHRQHDITA